MIENIMPRLPKCLIWKTWFVFPFRVSVKFFRRQPAELWGDLTITNHSASVDITTAHIITATSHSTRHHTTGEIYTPIICMNNDELLCRCLISENSYVMILKLTLSFCVLSFVEHRFCISLALSSIDKQLCSELEPSTPNPNCLHGT